MSFRLRILPVLSSGVFLLAAGVVAFAQVSPAEIRDPQLKAVEQTDFSQLQAVNRSIRGLKFPFSFVLSRYVGLDPKEQAEADARGVEFVRFHGRSVLKVTGNYNAAFNALMLTRNQRANQVFDQVAVPILTTVTDAIPPSSDFDAYGFEISYHVRTRTGNYDYEGKEILTVVLDKADAVDYLRASRDSARQEILDRSEIYVDGEDFGLALGQREAFQVSDSEKDSRHKSRRRTAAETLRAPSSQTDSETPEAAPAPAQGRDPDRSGQAARPDQVAARATSLEPEPQSASTAPVPSVRLPELAGEDFGFHPPAATTPATGPQSQERAILSGTAATQGDADALQSKLQAQLQALDQAGRQRFHFVDYAPSFMGLFRNQIYLQLTLRNPALYDRNATSIYKRAAQSFDLFLAPLLKDLLAKTPNDPGIAGLDVTVLDEFSPKASTSSEALEYLCPIGALRKFADADITNQDLINQSVVLVNGVRISLNLQQVE